MVGAERRVDLLGECDAATEIGTPRGISGQAARHPDRGEALSFELWQLERLRVPNRALGEIDRLVVSCREHEEACEVQEHLGPRARRSEALDVRLCTKRVLEYALVRLATL